MEWRSSTGPLPEGGVEYRIFLQSSPMGAAGHRPLCSLLNIFITNSEESLSIPCLHCSVFSSARSYYHHYRLRFTAAISRAVVLPTPLCASKIADAVLWGVLYPANYFNPDRNHDLRISVDDPTAISVDEHIDRALAESFAEAGPQRKPATLNSIIDMVMARAQLEALEGDKVESGWKDSEHTCTVCMDEIESPWESLTMPCSHVFHEKCLVRWLDNNHVCPVCRFELPLET